MKKWLDDLYAIILKRGFKTLDDVLKNKNKYDKKLTLYDGEGVINDGDYLDFDLKTLDYNASSIFIIEIESSQAFVHYYKRASENIYVKYGQLVQSPNLSSTLIDQHILRVTNNSGTQLIYKIKTTLLI